MFKKQISLHFSFKTQKIFSEKINKSLEIMEILQNRYSTEIWECSFKDNWNAIQMKSNSKSLNHIANHAAGIWVLKAFDPAELVFVYFFNTKAVKIMVKNQIHMNLSIINPKNKGLWFSGFPFWPYAQKRKPRNHRNSTKMS